MLIFLLIGVMPECAGRRRLSLSVMRESEQTCLTEPLKSCWRRPLEAIAGPFLFANAMFACKYIKPVVFVTRKHTEERNFSAGRQF